MTKIGEVDEKEISHKSLHQLFDQYCVVEGCTKLWESVQDKLFEELPNPGVQVNIVYSGTLDTMYEFEFDENPKPKTDTGHYVYPTSQKFTYGDGVVVSGSALVAGIKWAQDYKDQAANSKPVTLAEICSIHQRRKSVFTPDHSEVKENAYFGIDCNCAGTEAKPKDGSKCEHYYLLLDTKVVSYLLESTIDGVV